MTTLETVRLAGIRAQAAKWEALHPSEAPQWETPFLLKIIDEQAREIRQLKLMRIIKEEE